ncbi:MAG: MFS transporter [Bacteroidetes bacterium]|nr:MFS transporter [Bacteroidota bacterium]MBS1756655.1 MFS transporter [Bacteroidota bacterium]
MDSIKKLPKEFWHFLSARLFYTLGLRMISTIVIYQVFNLASTYMVGIAGLTEFLPAVATAMYAGHYIDTHNKKNILVSTYGFYILCAASLAIVSLPSLNLAVHTKISIILCTVFFTGIIRSFAQPAANAMIAAIVDREQLQKAISLNSSTYLSSSIAGHATGGLVIAFLGISNAYFVAAVLLFIAAIFALRIKPKPPYLTEIREPVIQAIKHGFTFVWSNKTLLGVISLDLFAVLFGGAVAFIPEIAEHVLHTGPIGYGFLNAAMDIGSLISILILLATPMKQKQGLKMLLAVAGFGLFIIVFGLSKVYWLSFLALAGAGFFDGISVVVRGTISQLETPDELRGRVSSINMIFINSSNELGQFESGITSKIMGTLPAVVFGGAMSMLVVIGTWVKFPHLRKIEY